MKKILIIGSNFGYKVYFNIIKNEFKNFVISMLSPHINKKKIINKIIKYQDYKDIKKGSSFDIIICATKPSVQYLIIKRIEKNFLFCKKLILEKPLAHKFKFVQYIENYLIKSGINFRVNFIFSNMKSFILFKNKIKNKKINKIIYTWNFKQAYFKNYKKTWKINKLQGGGLINFYGIHIIYNIIQLINLKKYSSIEIIKKKFTNKILTLITLVIYSKKSLPIYINLNSNSDKSLHKIEVFSENGLSHVLENKSKDWTKDFNLYVFDANKKKKYHNKRFSENRKSLTFTTIKELLNGENKQFLKDYINKIKLTNKICSRIC